MAGRVTIRENITGVVVLHKQDISIKQIPAQTGMSVRVCQKVAKRLVEEGAQELPAPCLQASRPKLISRETQKGLTKAKKV